MSFHRGSPHTASPGLSNEMSLPVTIRCHGSYLRGLEQGSKSGGRGTRHSSQSTQRRWWAFLCLHRRRWTEPMLLTPWACREEGLGGGLSTAVALPAAGNACKADSPAASALTQCHRSETGKTGDDTSHKRCLQAPVILCYHSCRFTSYFRPDYINFQVINTWKTEGSVEVQFFFWCINF